MTTYFLHGLGQKPSSWDAVLSELALPAVCPDLCSYFSGCDATYENLYRAFSANCGSMSGPVNLCGLSLGAVVALHYAMEHPQRVRSLVLIAGQVEMPKGLLKVQNVIFRFLPESAFTGMGLQKRDVLRLTGSMMDLSFSDGLEKIECPALMLCGERDRANQKAAAKLAAGIANAEFRVVRNAGHEVNVDAPGELAGILNDFWRKTVS